jgi:hypothetical protein
MYFRLIAGDTVPSLAGQTMIHSVHRTAIEVPTRTSHESEVTSRLNTATEYH